MFQKSLVSWICFCFIFGLAQSSSASEIILNGFASVYGRQSLTKNPMDQSTDDKGINFDNDSIIGLNISSHFAKDWTAVGQLVAGQRALSPSNVAPDWSPEFDWFFLTYEEPTTGLSVRVGRQLYPFSLTAEYVDVGLTLPWRTLPIQFRTAVFFKSFEGISVAYQKPIGDIQFNARIFGGDARSGQPVLGNNGYEGYEINNLIGVVSAFEGDGWKVQATYSQFRLILTMPNYQTLPLPSTLAKIEFGGMNHDFTIGGSYNKNHILGYLEYARACNSGFESCIADTYYGTLGYHLGSFLPHYTFSYGDWKIPGFFTGRETSHGFGINYQLDPSAVLKLEYLRQQDVGGAVFLTSVGTAESVAMGVDIVF